MTKPTQPEVGQRWSNSAGEWSLTVEHVGAKVVGVRYEDGRRAALDRRDFTDWIRQYAKPWPPETATR